jgi:hypothetical protein
MVERTSLMVAEELLGSLVEDTLVPGQDRVSKVVPVALDEGQDRLVEAEPVERLVRMVVERLAMLLLQAMVGMVVLETQVLEVPEV